MELSTSAGASSCIAVHIPSILWHRKCHYHVHKNLPLLSFLFQVNSVHTSYCISLIYTLIFSFHLRLDFTNGFFPVGFPTEIFCEYLIVSIHVTSTTDLVILDLITQYSLVVSTIYYLFIEQFSAASCSFFVGPNNLPYTLSLCSYMRVEVSTRQLVGKCSQEK
jgi:hypothetical protein